METKIELAFKSDGEKVDYGILAEAIHWVAEDIIQYIEEEGLVIGTYSNITTTPIGEENHDNVQLIAASKDLLEALEVALEALVPHYDDDNDGSIEAQAVLQGMAAINKAKGVRSKKK